MHKAVDWRLPLPGPDNCFEKLGFRFFKEPKVQSLGFKNIFVQLYTDRIQFHILIVICEFCYYL